MLCSIDSLMIEWHARYFTVQETQRVSSGMNISEDAAGRSAVYHWAVATQAGLERASKACGRTRIVSIDDESYMFDLVGFTPGLELRFSPL